MPDNRAVVLYDRVRHHVVVELVTGAATTTHTAGVSVLKSASSFLRELLTWHCSHLLLSAVLVMVSMV